MKTMAYVETTSHEYMAGRLIVKLKEGVSEHQINGLGKAIDVASTKAVGLTGVQIWYLSGKLTVEEIIAKYRESDLFEYVEPDYVIKVDPPSPYVTDQVNIQQAATIPSDNLFSNQWNLNNTGQTVNGLIGTADADIDAPEAWSIQKGDANLVIGVIDTGADYTHSDLSGNIWINPGEIAGDGIDNDGNGYTDDIHGWDFANGDNDPMDGNGHGTRVAGIIAATGNNANGITGIVWNAQIMPIKFLSDAGSGLTSDAILAINYATSMGVKLTNNSWGNGGYSTALYDAINTAEQQGALFIAGAGNGGSDKIGDNNDITPFYPSSYDLENIISVTSTTSTDSLSSFSNYGAVSVDLAAPGSDIYSTSKGGTYGYSSGTSMAAPHVTGAAALLWSRYPTLTAQQVKDTLLQSTDTLGSLAGMVASNGRLNVNNALILLNHIPTATDKTISINENSSYVFSAGDLGYSDADNDLFVSFNIASLTTAGALKLNGVDVVPNQIISAAEISLLTFTPEVDATGINYANFDFTVSDGIANSTTPNTISFNVINIIVGTNDNDNLLGTAGIDQILGLGGDDILNGAAGADSLIGELGNDSYVVDNAGDAVMENPGEGTDKVNSSVTYTLPANIENLTLTGAAVINGTGNDLANSIIGNAAINVLTGGAGNDALNGGADADSLIGGLGDDIYTVDNAGDSITENLSEGTDKVSSSVPYALPANVENLTLTGALAINGTGNDLANSLTGNAAINVLTGGAGNDTLNGGAGADNLIGGLGDDIYTVDNAGDVVTENLSEGTDKINSSVTYTLSANVENLTLTGSSAINGTGNDLANSLIGNAAINVLIGGAGNDTLNGGAGADSLTGGLGNDTYTVDNAGDAVTENLGEGTDKINSSVTYTLSTNVENLTLTGSSAINGTGNDLVNNVTGNTADNQLNGEAGNDTLNGGAGNDMLSGGTGKDTMAGGTGSDIFRFVAKDSIDKIVDYNIADDTIQLEDSIFTALTTMGTLAADNFIIGTSAADSNDFIVYNTATGALFYDTDGNGAVAAVQIATLTGGLALTNADFVVI